MSRKLLKKIAKAERVNRRLIAMLKLIQKQDDLVVWHAARVVMRMEKRLKTRMKKRQKLRDELAAKMEAETEAVRPKELSHDV